LPHPAPQQHRRRSEERTGIGVAGAARPAATRSFLGHPIGLATLFFVEMWERMSFYGMRALLILFLVDQVAHGGLWAG
jgi:hypothetical protein